MLRASRAKRCSPAQVAFASPNASSSPFGTTELSLSHICCAGEQGVKWTLDAVFCNHPHVSGVGVVKFARDETRARPDLPWQQVSDHYAIEFTLHL
jgi:hypothetical protein